VGLFTLLQGGAENYLKVNSECTIWLLQGHCKFFGPKASLASVWLQLLCLPNNVRLLDSVSDVHLHFSIWKVESRPQSSLVRLTWSLI